VRVRAGATTASLAGLLGALAPAAPAPAVWVVSGASEELARGVFHGTSWRVSATSVSPGQFCIAAPGVRLCAPRGIERDPGPGVFGVGTLGPDIKKGDALVFGIANIRARRARITFSGAGARPRLLTAKRLPAAFGWRMRWFVGAFHGKVARVAILDGSGRMIPEQR